MVRKRPRARHRPGGRVRPRAHACVDESRSAAAHGGDGRSALLVEIARGLQNKVLEAVAAGLPALGWDPRLVPVARAHSEEMFRLKYFSHQSPVSGSPFDRLRGAGISLGKLEHPTLESTVWKQDTNNVLVVAAHSRFTAPCKPEDTLAFTGSHTPLLLGLAQRGRRASPSSSGACGSGQPRARGRSASASPSRGARPGRRAISTTS